MHAGAIARSQYSKTLLASRRAALHRQVWSKRWESSTATAAKSTSTDSASTTATASETAATASELDMTKMSTQTPFSHPQQEPASSEVPESAADSLPNIVESETNPDPRLYRRMPQPKYLFEPQERPRYDPSKPFWRQEIGDDERITWGAITVLLALIPFGYWWYHYRTAWKKEQREKAIAEYLKAHPEKQYLADQAAAKEAAKAAAKR